MLWKGLLPGEILRVTGEEDLKPLFCLPKWEFLKFSCENSALCWDSSEVLVDMVKVIGEFPFCRLFPNFDPSKGILIRCFPRGSCGSCGLSSVFKGNL